MVCCRILGSTAWSSSHRCPSSMVKIFGRMGCGNVSDLQECASERTKPRKETVCKWPGRKPDSGTSIEIVMCTSLPRLATLTFLPGDEPPTMRLCEAKLQYVGRRGNVCDGTAHDTTEGAVERRFTLGHPRTGSVAEEIVRSNSGADFR